MKVIFLDFDGVLNDINFLMDFHKKEHKSKIEIDPVRMHRFFEIARQSQARIVLTSSWRDRPGVKEFFEDYGLEIWDKVKHLDDRSLEIQEWLYRNPVENYLILDDESSCYTQEQMSHAIITKECYSQEARINKPWFEGLQDKHIKWALDILNS